MIRLLFAVLLLVSFPSHAAVFHLCTLGDTQNGVKCSNDTSAWDHFDAAIDGIVAGYPPCDVVLWPGDLVDGRGWTIDCWCAAQGPGDPDCTAWFNPNTETYCGISACNDPEAKICDGGTPGWWCEFERIRNSLDKLEAAGVPWMVISGNHDTDNKNTPYCERTFSDYNLYFGPGKTSSLFDELGTYSWSADCPSLPSGTSEQAMSSYGVLTAAGAQWLLIGISWTALEYPTGTKYPGISEGVMNFVKGVLDSHKGMPTIPFTHTAVVPTCANADLGALYDDAWCPESVATFWENTWTGMTIYDELLPSYSNIFMVLSGHIRGLGWNLSTVNGHAVLGDAVDYTDHITGAPVEWQQPADGGGGVVQLIGIDPVEGKIWTHGYSPYEEAFIGLFDTEPASHFDVQMPMCTDRTRFNFPAAACPQPDPIPNTFSK